MTEVNRKCAYCGEGTKCGWYGQGDGTYLCDDCGDMVYDLDQLSIGDLSMGNSMKKNKQLKKLYQIHVLTLLVGTLALVIIEVLTHS